MFGSGDGSKKTSKKREREVFDLGFYKQNVHHISQWWAFGILALVFALATVTKWQLFNFPVALSTNSGATDRFIGERARADLQILNDFGPRPTGSYANEVLAVDFLKREISFIQQAANPAQRIYADVQKVSGAYWGAFKPHGMTNVYRNVQNVVVKLVGAEEAQGRSNHTLMLNCHFDSVAGSPGASDDAASCCVMLETLRVLSKQPLPTKHSVLFLFNGAEETPLQAAHGFITQHEWAGNVRAFLNLESVGSNGKEILFQSGPYHSWLIDMYQEAAVHPFGQAAAEELFQSGVVPSDTDFRIFRDFGHIPGMDFAHVMNGYRYHTKYDHIDYIPAPVLQRTGDNVFALVRRMANSDELANTEAHATGRKVFYDILGLFFVSYSVSLGHVLNVTVALLSILLPYILLNRTTKGTHARRIRKEMFIGFVINLLAAAAAAAVCYLIALELDLTGHSMVWYHHTVFAVILYCLPVVLVGCVLHRLFTADSRSTPLSLGLKVQARLNGSNIMWGALVIYITALGYRSAYLFMLPLAVTLVANVVIGLTGIQNSIKKWLYVHLFGQTLVILWTTHCYHLVLAMFIPVAGRSGAAKNPEVSIGIICCMMTIYISSFLTPLVALLNKTKWFFISLIGMFVLTRWGCLSLTHVGFPYRDHDAGGNPTPQRHTVTHTIRTVFDIDGKVTLRDSGFYFKLMDRNAEKTIESLMAPEIPVTDDENGMCAKLPFCGLPFYSCRQLHTDGLWLPGPAPILEEEAVLKLNSNTKISETERQLDFTIFGNVLISFQLRPHTGVQLTGWNITPTVPEPNEYKGQRAYFVMMTHGIDASPKNVTLNFQTTLPNYDGPLIDINLVTFHFEYHKHHTSTFATMLSKLPTWAFAVPSVASIQARTY